MDNQTTQDGAAIESTPLLSAGLFVIEVRRRRRDKTLAPWKLRAAFVDRDDAFDVYGKWHQRERSRVLSPNDKALQHGVAAIKPNPLMARYIAFNRQASQCTDIAKWCDLDDDSDTGEVLRDIAAYLRDRSVQILASGKPRRARKET
jgi:hypothetical protein